MKGKASDPQISGDLGLLDGSFKLDYLGCSYRIPNASVRINNRSITWGNVDVYDSYGNFGVLSGSFTHNLFQDMRMRIAFASRKFEIVKLTAAENSLFYGNVIAAMDSFTIRGPFNNIRLHAYNLSPAANSHIYLPVILGGDLNTYSYVSFKTYGQTQTRKSGNSQLKLDLAIDATLNDLAEMTIVLDPATGDAITCRGDGNIQLSIPAGNDMRITGLYIINRGTYDFTFQELFHRQFQLNSGSTISFTGPFFSTIMDVNATYSRKARLYDLLTEAELTELKNSAPNEITDAKQAQTVNVLMNMKGTLAAPELSFNMELPDKRSFGTYAYTKLYRINQDERQKFDQVGSFLLINSFLPSDGLGSGAVAGNFVLNNASQLFTKSASAGLTTLVNKLIGDSKL
ncbi:MAG: hypothetical protein EBZ77_16700, partial [Chitinophagia bacterium]|nr:hypothetical protein [Chitinophagia bacterium]